MSLPFVRPPRSCRHAQRGGIAVIVAISALVLFGFAGLAIDLGRMYVDKTELQTAADACALAAAAELSCQPTPGTPCPSSYLQNAEAAGIYAAGRNLVEFQSQAVVITPADVKFSTVLAPNENYLSRAAGASTNSRYVMCTARRNGLMPWFMAVLGAGEQDIAAAGVATLAPSQSACPTSPIGICNKPGGYTKGEWITGSFTSNGNNDDLSGSFRWVDYTPESSGNSEARDLLAGTTSVCGVKVGDDIRLPGVQQAVKMGYNTRFGMYPNGANAYTPDTSPPDRTGYAYPNKNPAAGFSLINFGGDAYADYVKRQAAGTPFTNNQYGVSGPGSNISGNPIDSAKHLSAGGNRRLVTTALIDNCGTSVTPLSGMACVLMLNPMSNGATGEIYLQYIGLANEPGSPCPAAGFSGGPGGTGPQVPTLVQ